MLMLIVNEMYGPVGQGEGRTAGLPVVFLRLSTCNLRCGYCDSSQTWNWIGTKFSHPDKFDPKLEAHKMSVEQVKDKIYALAGDVRALVISGGEPMLQQERLIPLLKELKKDNWHVEVETNGTIEPTDEFIGLISQFNCSPKTGNSGPDNTKKMCIVIPALMKIASCGDKATFKFVVQSDFDWHEINKIIDTISIKPESVWLMPEGRTKEEQLQRQDQVEKLSKEKGYNFSPRLQILQYGDKRAV